MTNKNLSDQPENFATLVDVILGLHEQLTQQASRAVNIALTLRNWMIGYYIAEYQLQGADRAQYGDKLLASLADALQQVSNCNRRQLYRYLRFYQAYPYIVGTLSPQLRGLLPTDSLSQKVVTSPQSSGDLIQRLSYSQLELLVELDDATQRTFYEQECIRGNWSVRELKRQITSLYYQRSGLSHNKTSLTEQTQSVAEQTTPQLAIRDPYVFEFLGLKPVEVMSESQLEDQLLDKLQGFMLELGNGFCFEARQKRILIGDTHGFVDLVFYHRILKCHVLIELKLADFSHEHVGQLNTYVNWYRQHMMSEGDHPPIGILLCTRKDHALMEYALAGMDNRLFVSRYQLELPKKEDMQRFLEQQLAQHTQQDH